MLCVTLSFCTAFHSPIQAPAIAKIRVLFFSKFVGQFLFFRRSLFAGNKKQNCFKYERLKVSRILLKD
jgi:hypothetical protein